MKKFLKDLFSNDEGVSSKRIAGIAGWLVFCLILISSFVFSFDISVQQSGLVSTLAYSSAALISGGAIDRIIKGKQK